MIERAIDLCNPVQQVQRATPLRFAATNLCRQSLWRTLVEIVDPLDPAKDKFLREPVYHGDPDSADSSILVYRVYGADLDDRLKALGFAVDDGKLDCLEHGIMDTELFYCRLEHK